MSKIFTVSRGTKDILPSDTPIWQEIEKKTRQILTAYNYREIRTPIFEQAELFVRSAGQTTDFVQKQMLYLAAQKDGDADDIQAGELSVRPEGTAAVVRSYIENQLDKSETLSKLFYMGPMFRGERPQKGRLRQFHQIGVEAIGPNSASPYLDAEVIALAVYLLKDLGVSGFQLKLNSLGSPEDKANFAEKLRGDLKLNFSRLCFNCQNRFERNVLRILDCKKRECQEVVRQLDLKDSYLSAESREYFAKVRQALELLKIPYEISPTLVRGLDYYTHTVFEISHSGLGSQDALGAGGRYNNLVSQLGGPQVDAIGFALGVERIILALPEKTVETLKPTVFAIAMDEKSFQKAFEIVNNLRQAAITSEINYKMGSMKSQMRAADKSGAKFVMILGESEMNEKVVTLKDMKSGEQEKVSWTNVVEKLKRG